MDLPTIMLAVAIFLVIWAIVNRREVYFSRYEYLNVLTHEWKEGRKIREEMEERKGGKISGPRFYVDLASLVDEGLAKMDIQPLDIDDYTLHIAYFKITDEGGKKLREPWRDNPPVIPLTEGT